MPIVLLTDFGTRDGYVGSLKGVLASRAPEIPVIDLGHDLPAFGLAHAAYVLTCSYAYFPIGTLFIVVVDPGVGSARRPLLIETEKYFFLGPDNGVLSPCLAAQKVLHCLELNRPEFFLKPTSGTFHGRDIFAPVAAHLCRGVPIERLGTKVAELCPLPIPPPRVLGKNLEGNIWTFDHFGNAITTLHRGMIQGHFGSQGFSATLPRIRQAPIPQLSTHYASGSHEEVLMLFGSGGYLEIAMNSQSAQEHLGLKVGDPVVLTLMVE